MRDGVPTRAVILSPEDLASLDDTLELLSNPDALAEIERARTDIKSGSVLTADELRAKYIRR